MSIYDYDYTDNSGKFVEMSDFKNKVVLIVNVASQCGLTPQYAGIENLYKKFKDLGFEVIGFPCNQFGLQEPGSDEEIKSFCETNFGVTFKLASKVHVNGQSAHPIYKYLKSVSKNDEDISWNFEKFLILKDGSIKNFDPHTSPESLESIIQDSLK
jgi:glutathione peroxidase